MSYEAIGEQYAKIASMLSQLEDELGELMLLIQRYHSAEEVARRP